MTRAAARSQVSSLARNHSSKRPPTGNDDALADALSALSAGQAEEQADADEFDAPDAPDTPPEEEEEVEPAAPARAAVPVPSRRLPTPRPAGAAARSPAAAPNPPAAAPPAPSPQLHVRSKGKRPRPAGGGSDTATQRTMIPVCLTLAVLLPAFGLYWLLNGEDTPVRLLPYWMPLGLAVVGLLMGAAGLLTMFRVARAEP